VAKHLAAGLKALGPFTIVHGGDPHLGIAAVSWRLKDEQDQGFNLYDLSDRLRTRGWLIAAYPLPADRENETVMRALVRHGFTIDMAEMLLSDIIRGMNQLMKHPLTTSLTRAEAGGFTHNATAAVPSEKSASAAPNTKARSGKKKS
jgi:glutamate decarboxylase